MKYCLPENISPEQFLAEYWQKKPLLIKGGLQELVGMFEPDDILGLALDPEATARLLIQQAVSDKDLDSPLDKSQDMQWALQQSPLNEEMFTELPEQWTVLVQNLEQWSPELGDLWRAFDFIPQWQRDDIMVSYAPKGGSVGKHYDDYDVFLAQGYGHRRWQLGQYCDETTAFIPNQPIRIFDDMGEIIFDEVLEPGDVLYVPPKLSHFGLAQDNCLTFSFGFRRPNLMQVLDSVADIATSEHSLFVPLLLEQPLQPSGKLDASSIAQIKSQLLDMLQSSQGDTLVAQAVSEVVSKRQYDILVPEDTLNLDELAQALNEGASLHPDFNSRLIYTDIDNDLRIYANGQPLEDIGNWEKALLKRLADGEAFVESDIITAFNLDTNKSPAIESNSPDAWLLSTLSWLENGWVWLAFND